MTFSQLELTRHCAVCVNHCITMMLHLTKLHYLAEMLWSSLSKFLYLHHTSIISQSCTLAFKFDKFIQLLHGDFIQYPSLVILAFPLSAHANNTPRPRGAAMDVP